MSAIGYTLILALIPGASQVLTTAAVRGFGPDRAVQHGSDCDAVEPCRFQL
jgi:hypothetical protein